MQRLPACGVSTRPCPTHLEDCKGAVEAAQHQLLLPVSVHVRQQLRMRRVFQDQECGIVFGDVMMNVSIDAHPQHPARMNEWMDQSTHHGRRRVVGLEGQLLPLQKGRHHRGKGRPLLLRVLVLAARQRSRSPLLGRGRRFGAALPLPLALALPRGGGHGGPACCCGCTLLVSAPQPAIPFPHKDYTARGRVAKASAAMVAIPTAAAPAPVVGFLLAACWTPHVNSNLGRAAALAWIVMIERRGSIDRWIVGGVISIKWSCRGSIATMQFVAYAKSNLIQSLVSPSHRTYGSTSTAHTHTHTGVGRGKARRRGGIISSGRRRVFCLAACLVDRSVEIDV